MRWRMPLAVRWGHMHAAQGIDVLGEIHLGTAVGLGTAAAVIGAVAEIE